MCCVSEFLVVWTETETLQDEIELREKLNKELFLELHELNMGWVRHNIPTVPSACNVVPAQ